MLRNMKQLIVLAFSLINFCTITWGHTLLIPIKGKIDYAQECIIRRGLKQAQKQSCPRIILEIHTPGGNVDNMLAIIEALKKSNLDTIAYIREAISAGSFIANACNQIYFHPQGLMGAAAVINGEGKDLDGNLQAKIDSYLWAKIRTNCEKFPHRYAFQRAMMDKNFVLKTGETILKPSGELLTLTAQEALKTYPDLPALSSGTFLNVDELLKNLYPQETYEIFEPSGFEQLAQMLTPFIPLISGLGFLLILIELKTPGFGLMGLCGIGLFACTIMVHFLAGLGGTEALEILAIGAVCVFLDLFLLGSFFLTFFGFCLILGGLWWSGIDVWPTIPLTLTDYFSPLKSMCYALLSWGILLLLAYKLGWIKRGMHRLTLAKSIKHTKSTHDEWIGQIAETVTPLIPSGKAQIYGEIIDVRSENGDIPANTKIILIAKKDFAWLVRKSF